MKKEKAPRKTGTGLHGKQGRNTSEIEMSAFGGTIPTDTLKAIDKLAKAHGIRRAKWMRQALTKAVAAETQAEL
jgi:hypothetical protein